VARFPETFDAGDGKVFSWTKIAFILLAVLALASPVLAADTPEDAQAVSTTSILTGTPFGVGLVILGAGYGIGKIGSAAVESMARQPEVATNIQTGMIISAALIEGATFFGLIVCIISA
jgi:F-type H+-transporting ATPase subunit c